MANSIKTLISRHVVVSGGVMLVLVGIVVAVIIIIDIGMANSGKNIGSQFVCEQKPRFYSVVPTRSDRWFLIVDDDDGGNGGSGGESGSSSSSNNSSSRNGRVAFV